MRIIHCDLCGEKIGDVTKNGVETKNERLSLKIGKWNYPEVCATCYSNVLEFTEGMTRIKTT